MAQNMDRTCPHCPFMTAEGLSHNKLCECGHHHADHVFTGGCMLCNCDGYDQTRSKFERTPEQPDKAFYALASQTQTSVQR